jgi:hypothetical protein
VASEASSTGDLHPQAVEKRARLEQISNARDEDVDVKPLLSQ